MKLDKMKEQVVIKIHNLLEVFEINTGMTLNYVPEIRFSQKGTTAGTCEYNYMTGVCILNFNLAILKDNFDDFVERTVAHEVAHYLTDRVYGVIKCGNRVSHHGKEWKRMMRVLGVRDIKRCHSYRVEKVSRRKTKKFLYTCGCGKEHVIATVTHNRLQRGQRNYVCKYCRTELTFIGRIRAE